MKIQGQVQTNQELTNDEFSLGPTEITVNEPVQDDITLADSKVTDDVPLVSTLEENLDGEAKSIKAETTKVTTPKVEELDFVKTMRENNLEIFTKELFTDNVSDEDFANQLLKDKYFGRESYTKEIDFEKTYEYYPKEVSEEISAMKSDVARRIANLSPEDKKTLGEAKGSDELIYNEYLKLANDNMGKMALASAAVGAVMAVPAVGVVATASAFAAGTLAAFGAMYGTAEVVNSIDRANKTSPEDIKALRNTKEDKQGVLYLADEYIPNNFTKAMIDMLEREEDDTEVERYVKEFGSLVFDAVAFRGLFKGVEVGANVASKTTDVLRGTAKRAQDFIPTAKKSSAVTPELSETIEKLNDFIRVKKTVKEHNRILTKAKQSFDEIIESYESTVPPIPKEALKNSIDYDKLAGEAYDSLTKSGFKDDNAYEAFKYYSAKGSNHTLGTKRTVELAKDASEADLAKIANPKKFGKGSEGTGTTTMDLANKIDEIGEQRLFAQNRGDFELDAKLDSLQSTLLDRVNIAATQQGGNLQEINRSMPLRRSMMEQYNKRTQIALELKHDGLTKKARARLEKELIKTEKHLKNLTANMKGATNEELVAMGIANTIYSNMLGGAAVSKAAIGGLVSTANNSTQLAVRGVSPKQIFKMQVNAAKQLKDDISKLDLSQLKSDVVHGTINNRFKSKNVADLKASSTDSVVKKGLKSANKAVNVTASPIQAGLGSVDYMLDTFNSRARVTEAWLDYSTRQKALGRTSEELIDELNMFVDNPEKMTHTFNNEVLRAAEEGLATDKMMLSKPHSKGYYASKVAWGIDKAFNTASDSLILNTTLKFVNPFTRTGASMLDSIAENSAIGMFRSSAPNGIFGALTPRQITGTAAAIGLFYGIEERLTIVPQASEKTAGMMGLRSGIQVGGHQYPMEVLGVYGEVIEKFMIMQSAMEVAALEGVDTSNISPILGGLLEVTTAYGMAENIKQIAQNIINVPTGKTKLEVTKIIENFMPAGYLIKAGADLDSGSLAANPYLMQVFGEFDTEFGNAKRRDAFGTPLSEGETLEIDRNFSWLIDRSGEDKAGLEVKKMFLDAGVWANEDLAAFKTKDKLIPYKSIRVNGSYETFSATMTPLTNSISIGTKGTKVKVTSATKNKALGVMSLEKNTMSNIIKDEITNLNYMVVSTPEARMVRDAAKSNLIQLGNGTETLLKDLSQYGMNKTLPKALKMLMENDAPNVTAKFKQKRYEVMNLMRYNRTMFGGDLAKQKEFFTRVNRVKDTVLFYNAIKDLGTKFMQNSAEAVSAEIERIEYIKSK